MLTEKVKVLQHKINNKKKTDNKISVFIIYKSETETVSKLCIKNTDIAQVSILVPHIGETFIDRNKNIEYEVKDVIRSIYNNEYGIQVYLQRRDNKKYKEN